MRALINVVALVCFSLVAIRAPAAELTEARKPNVIFILADDLGWTDLACYGSTYYETPNLDRLASQGMRFTDGYTCAANCAPTRAALMSGQYGPRTGVYTVGGIQRFDWQSRPLRPIDNVTNLPLEKFILPQAMKSAGYATGMFGKWHLGEDAEHHPSARGFDEAISTAGKHFNFTTNPKVEYPRGQYLADFLTDNAVRFITAHKDEPFFLYLPHFGVHAPHQAKPELIEKFKNKPHSETAGQHDPSYAAMIYSVDESVGRIMKTLDELKLADNTILIFSSDNGGVGGYERAGLNKGGITDNAPLRGGKGMFYEGGVRVPFIWRWPGHIPEGATSHEPIISVDLYPTFLALAGGTPKEGYPLDGVDLAPVLTRKSPDATLGRDALYWHFPGYLGAGLDQWRSLPVGAIRSGDFKLLEFFEDQHVELYNLKTDLSQTTDIAAKEPEKTQALREKLHAWRSSVGAEMPTENPDRRPPRVIKKQKGKDVDNDD